MGTERVFVARLVGLPVYGPDGERIGRVRDLVASLRVDANPPRVLGMVVEVMTRRRIFVPMLRVTTIDPGAVTLATGLISLRRFVQRPNEVLIVGASPKDAHARPRTEDPTSNEQMKTISRFPSSEFESGEAAKAEPASSSRCVPPNGIRGAGQPRVRV